MSAYSSLTLSRRKATELILKAVAEATNEQLARMASRVLEDGTLYNVYMVVDGAAEDDEKV